MSQYWETDDSKKKKCKLPLTFTYAIICLLVPCFIFFLAFFAMVLKSVVSRLESRMPPYW